MQVVAAVKWFEAPLVESLGAIAFVTTGGIAFVSTSAIAFVSTRAIAFEVIQMSDQPILCSDTSDDISV